MDIVLRSPDGVGPLVSFFFLMLINDSELGVVYGRLHQLAWSHGPNISVLLLTSACRISARDTSKSCRHTIESKSRERQL